MDGSLPDSLRNVCNPLYPPLHPDTSFRLDEDYSEDTRSLDDGDSAMGLEPRNGSTANLLENPLIALHSAVMSLDERQRSEHAYQVLRTLRTSSVAAIVDLLFPLLHIDPVAKLPPELTSQIFSYLPPPVLLEASKVSKAWRARTLDSRLWRLKFLSEGWVLNRPEITRFENSYYSPGQGSKSLSRKAESPDGEPRAKKRAMSRDDSNDVAVGSSLREQLVQSRPLGSLFGHRESQDEQMCDVETRSSRGANAAPHLDFTTSSMYVGSLSTDGASFSDQSLRTPSPDENFDLRDPLVLPVSEKAVRVNFHHLYKQRRRLEENWMAGRYKSFQLPHRDHPEEAHSECVYTIQYSGKHLVSGSRDRTLRIWDLDTQRLIRRPLSGHHGSVLCLQFDERPHEDVIISGSSDTDVIVWQFSTGKLLKRITHAHGESVLNLKFDHRYLVTCSKDKMIKVWNRQLLRPGSDDYPIRGVRGGGKFPSYVLDLSRISSPGDMEQHFTAEQLAPIPEYSLIMRIDSHSAAVNAVHIYGDELASASGDREVRVFNLRTGIDTALCKGHNKGIACVQYDGTRIVSGSSDDTIRIFDPISQAEVGCLQGHAKLVRTVQAAFGDAPGTEEELEQEARKVDVAFIEAKRRGDVSANTSRQRVSRDRNAGSRRPQDIMAVGAKLPPGGGGSQWARIVSGSYDETVIIWRKAQDGRWVIGHRLKQADALRAAGGPLVARSERRNHVAQIVAHQAAQQAQAAAAAAAATAAATAVAGATHVTTTTINTAPNPAAAAQAGNAHPPTWSQGFSLPHPLQHLAQQGQDSPPHHTQTQTLMNGAVPNVPVPVPVPVPMNVPLPINIHHPHPSQNARVFKLQFDARRIVACSQDPKIVGWDFANGDDNIIECSKFFGPPN